MSKKKWLLAIIIIAVLGYLLISKVFPAWGAGIDNTLGPAVAGLITGIKTAITNSPVWQQFDVWFGVLFGGIITALLMWQGHTAFNKLRGAAVKSAVKEAGYQAVPTATPTVIPSKPVVTAVAPAPVVPEPTPEQEA